MVRPLNEMVHPLNECDIWDGGDAKTARRTMAPPGSPDERVLVSVPISGGALAGTWSVSPAAWIGASNCPDGFSSGRHGGRHGD
jgi:hypothetical protein